MYSFVFFFRNQIIKKVKRQNGKSEGGGGESAEGLKKNRQNGTLLGLLQMESSSLDYEPPEVPICAFILLRGSTTMFAL